MGRFNGDSKTAYAETLIELAKNDERIVVLECDLGKASGTDLFKAEFPDRYINVGISEQDMVGTAAGLAAKGKIPFASTFACFISQRACDQAVNSVCYNKFNVKLIGTYAGLTSEKNGGTHISVEDLAIFRSMPNMKVIDVADDTELSAALKAAANIDSPMYIRVAKGPYKEVFKDYGEFILGKASVLKEGKDISIISAGITTYESLQAAKGLQTMGIDVEVVHMPTIKPIDKQAIIDTAIKTGTIVTVENHSINGGLGSAVAEVTAEYYPVKVVRMGISDVFGETAKLDWLMDKHKISQKHIEEKVLSMR